VKTAALVKELDSARRTLMVVSDRYDMNQERARREHASNFTRPPEEKQ
jgi:hypothetical protein